MDEQKATSVTRSVIKSVLWSIGAVFAIIGTIEMLAYSGDPIPYFIVAAIFGVLWAAFVAIIKTPKKSN